MTPEDHGRPFAVLFGYDPANDRCTADPFCGVHEGVDPITRAHLLRESVEDDFPGFLWAVTGNDAAQELRKAALINAVLGPGR